MVLAITGIVALLALGWFFFLRDDDEATAGRVVRLEATEGACWSAILPGTQLDQPPEQQSCGNADLKVAADGAVSVTKTGPEGTLNVIGLVDDEEVSRQTITAPSGSVTIDPQESD